MINVVNVEMLTKIRAMLVDLEQYPDLLRMRYFGGIGSPKTKTVEEAAHCGCTGCIMGWAWTCVEPLLPNEEAIEYFRRTCLLPETDDSQASFVFCWLFDSSWDSIAPKPKDAIKRIDWLLKNGVERLLVPGSFRNMGIRQFDIWEEIKDDSSI